VALEHGRVTQIGRHSELVSTAGLYRRLWHIQTNLGEEAGAAVRGLP
jgi:ABC-type multidrug transport system fused ATPase/permease subunit